MLRPIQMPQNIDIRGNSIVQNKPKIKVPNQDVNSRPGFELRDQGEFNPEIRKENPETAEFGVKNTNPTLVEFHNKNASLPEWRLQLKNAVRQRANPAAPEAESFQRSIEIADSPAIRRKNLAAHGSNTLKNEKVLEPAFAVDPNANPKLAAALDRIEKSRRKFLKIEKPEFETFGTVTKPNNSLLYFSAKPNDHLPVSNNAVRFESGSPSSLRSGDDHLDTNKLPALPKTAVISSSFSNSDVASELIEGKFGKNELDHKEGSKDIDQVVELEENEIEEFELHEIDDCAPLAMRFNSGLFDLIIGLFVSLLLLVPFMSFGGEWFGLAGILAFAATTSIVMFLYLTTAVALYGRTLGMKLFSLEIIDIEGEEYPTIHQAAVSSSVYLITLVFGGVGFLTLFFNDEGRAAHDIISRTIVVKEF